MCLLLLRPRHPNPTYQGWTGVTAPLPWAQEHNQVGAVGPVRSVDVSAVLSLGGDHRL